MNSLFLYSVLFSFFLGSIPFGVIVGYVRKTDVKKQGSGNIGFANSLRIMGWGPALIVLVGDIAKGFFPCWYAWHSFNVSGVCIIGLAAIAGHIFSPWLKCRGGKGVATMMGVSLALQPVLGLIAMAMWALVFLLKRISSLASLITVLLLPAWTVWLAPQLINFYLILLGIIIYTHRSNIVKLINKEESKIL